MTSAHPSVTPGAARIDPAAAAPFDPVKAGRGLLHESRNAALSTLDPGGFPYGVITNLLPDYDGSPVFFAAALALHARNMRADDRVSLALASFARPDALAQPRMTLVGRARPVGAEAFAALQARYIARFPKSKLYFQLPDALLFRLEVTGLTIGGGPARNASGLEFTALRVDLSGAAALLAAESAVLAEVNAEPGLTAALARKAGAGGARWKAIALDPEG